MTKELLYTVVSSGEAERLGIINRGVPVDELREETQPSMIEFISE